MGSLPWPPTLRMARQPLIKHLTRRTSSPLSRIFLNRYPLATLGRAAAMSISSIPVTHPRLQVSWVWAMATPTASMAERLERQPYCPERKPPLASQFSLTNMAATLVETVEQRDDPVGLCCAVVVLSWLFGDDHPSHRLPPVWVDSQSDMDADECHHQPRAPAVKASDRQWGGSIGTWALCRGARKPICQLRKLASPWLIICCHMHPYTIICDCN